MIAVDVGGTSIKCALVSLDGSFRAVQRRPTRSDAGHVAVVETIVGTATDLTATARRDGLEPVACGVVVPAVVDEAGGIVVFAANLGLRDVPLRTLIAEATGLPTALGHDVRAGAVAEARLGAGRQARRMFFIALGTGIAGALAVDGRVDPGAHGASGEIGHVAIRTGPDAIPCACGGRGCLERYASAAAVARAYASRAGSDSTVDATDSAEVVRRVGAGEERASLVWREAVEALADGLLVAIALHDPELVVIGGGLARAGATLLEPLEKALIARRTFHQLPRLALAELGDEAGVRGAALLALDGVRG